MKLIAVTKKDLIGSYVKKHLREIAHILIPDYLGGTSDVNDHFTFVIRVSKAIALHEFRRYELKVDFNFNKFSVKIQILKQHS